MITVEDLFTDLQIKALDVYSVVGELNREIANCETIEEAISKVEAIADYADRYGEIGWGIY